MEEENQLLFLNSRNETMELDKGMHNRDDKKWFKSEYIFQLQLLKIVDTFLVRSKGKKGK